MFFTYKNQSIFAFSGTHGMHREMTIPESTDILICAGDAISDFSTDGLTTSSSGIHLVLQNYEYSCR